MEIVSRTFAREQGLGRYFTGQPCRNGHTCERFTRRGHCVQCLRNGVQAWKDRMGPEAFKIKQAEYDLRFKTKDPARKAKHSADAKRRMLERDPEYTIKSTRAWREKNAEFLAAMKPVWAKAHYERIKAERPELLKLRRAASNAACRGKSACIVSEDGLSAAVRRVWENCGGKCAACASTSSLELDHIVAVTNGGANEESNFQFLCRPCNRSKGFKDHAEWLARRTQKEYRHAA